MEPQRTPFRDIAQTLGAYIAVPVALLYPAGLFALFAQITHYFFVDFSTAWYAASLVNRTVVMGKGANVLIPTLVASLTLSTTIAQILLTYDKSRAPSGFERRGALFAKLIALSLLILILYVIYSRIMAGNTLSLFALRGRLSTECNIQKAMRYQLNVWPDSLLPAVFLLGGCLLGGWVIYRVYLDHYQSLDANNRQSASEDFRLRLRFFSRGVTEGWLLSGLAIAYAASIFASIVLAYYTPISVPYLTYGNAIEHRGKPKPTENAFLSHTEGQWYFLHRIEMDTDNNPKRWTPPVYTIVSLSEGEVKYVRLHPNPPLASCVAPLPLGFGYEPLLKDPCKSR